MKPSNDETMRLSILALIRTRKIDNPIKSHEIEELYSTTGAQVRSIVHDARFAGHPIGSSDDGYFECQSFKEWEPTRRHLFSRATSILSLLKKVDAVFAGEQQGIFGEFQ